MFLFWLNLLLAQIFYVLEAAVDLLEAHLVFSESSVLLTWEVICSERKILFGVSGFP